MTWKVERQSLNESHVPWAFRFGLIRPVSTGGWFEDPPRHGLNDLEAFLGCAQAGPNPVIAPAIHKQSESKVDRMSTESNTH